MSQYDSVPNQSSREAQERQLGYGYGVSGIPLGETMPQDSKHSVEPNRDDTDFNVEGTLDSDYAHDYFDDEEKRLPDPLEERRAIPPQDAWSIGIADEENPEFEELDKEFLDDQALPEMGLIEVVEKPTSEQLDAK